MTDRKRLLLVGDNGGQVSEHARVLAMLGETFGIASGAEAAGMLDTADILLLDRDSVQLVAEARRAEPRLPIVMLLDPERLDGVAHLLGYDDIDLLVTPCEPADYAAALAASRLRAGRTSALFEDAARRLFELSEEVARIARAITLSETRAPRMPDGSGEHDAIDARSLRALIDARRLREEFLPTELFGEPAWDMLLDLTAARLEGKKVSVTDLTIAAAVPPTMALRYIKTMVEWGLLSRQPDRQDGRRVFLELADEAYGRMRAWCGASRKAGLKL